MGILGRGRSGYICALTLVALAAYAQRAHAQPTPAPQPPPAQPEQPPPAPPPDAPPAGTCTPECRTGFTCVKGQCISLCNPACPDTMQCTSYGECAPIPGVTPPPAPPPPAAPPTAPPAAAQPTPPPTAQPAQPPPGYAGPLPPPEQDSARWGQRDDEPGVRFHDGLYLRLGIGGGAIGANVERNDVSDPTPLHIGGFVVPVELAIGGTPSPGVVIGGGLYGLHVPSAHYTAGRGDFVQEEDADYGSIGMVGPFVDVYFDPRRGIHFQLAPCFTTVAPGESDSIVTGEVSGSGFGAMAGLGVETWAGEQWGIGVLARVQYASLELEDEAGNTYDFQMLAPSVLLTATLH